MYNLSSIQCYKSFYDSVDTFYSRLKKALSMARAIVFTNETGVISQLRRCGVVKKSYINFVMYVDVIKWKRFPSYWLFFGGESPLDSFHKGS